MLKELFLIKLKFYKILGRLRLHLRRKQKGKNMLIQVKMKKHDFGNRYWVDIIKGKVYSNTYNEPRELYTSENRGGYKKVKLYDNKGNKFIVFVHRIVIESYLFSIFPDMSDIDVDKYTVDHIDFDPRNNNIFNLRYMSRYDNNSRKSNNVETWNKDLSDKLFTMYFVNFITINEVIEEFSKLGKGEKAIYTALSSSYAKKWCEKKGIPYIRRHLRNHECSDEEESIRIKKYIKSMREERAKKQCMALPEEILSGVCSDYFCGSVEGSDIRKIKMRYNIPLRYVYIILESEYAKDWCKRNNKKHKLKYKKGNA